jgi:hypothetical protein
MVINKELNEHVLEVQNLGCSDHLAQVLKMSVDAQNYMPVEIIKRRFSKNKIAKFKDMWKTESWEGIYLTNNVNESYNLFLNRFLGYFRRAFPKKIKKVDKNNNWITRGIKILCQKMRFLKSLKAKVTISRDALHYIERYIKSTSALFQKQRKRMTG